MAVTNKWDHILLAYVAAMPVCAIVYLSGQKYLAAYKPASNPAPQVALDDDVHDFGHVRRGVILHHDFRIRNSGGRKLLLYREGGVDPIRVDSGDAADVTVALHSAERWGRTQKNVRFTTNDPERPRLTLTVTAVVGY